MPFQLESEQYAELKSLYNSFPVPEEANLLDYAELYDKVLEYVSEYETSHELTQEELKTVLWIKGAANVNRGVGVQSDFIREYNNLQSEIRYDTPVPNGKMNFVSDKIVINVISQVLLNYENDGASHLPIIDDIARYDAQPAAQFLFQGDLKPGGWAGNPLFLFLDYGEPFSQNILNSSRGTYDLLSIAKVAGDIGFSWSAIFDGTLFGLIWDGVGTANEVDSLALFSDATINNAANAASDFLENYYNVTWPLIDLSLANIVLDRLNHHGTLTAPIMQLITRIFFMAKPETTRFP